jgi:hypothetical protein
MGLCRTKPPTLDLRLGKNNFPVKKSQLFEKLGLLQDSPALLGVDHYRVRSRVSRQNFEEFVRIVKGGPLVVSESTRDSFSLLAKEFGFDELSVACREFVASDGKSRCVEPAAVKRASVTIASLNRSNTYESLDSLYEINSFVNDLAQAKEDCIVLDGVNGRDRLVEKAVEAVYSNTVANFPDGHPKNPFLALALWKIQQGFYLFSINSCIYCLNRLHEMAPTNVDKARLLLLSQCDFGSYGDFIPLPTADWDVIGDAITLLLLEKNGRTHEATELLGKLSDTGRYDEILDRCRSETFCGVVAPEETGPEAQDSGDQIHAVGETTDKPSWFGRLLMPWFGCQ